MDITRFFMDHILVIVFFILAIIALIVHAIRNKRPEPIVPPEICALERKPDGDLFARCPVCKKVNKFPEFNKEYVEIKCKNCGARLRKLR